MKYSFMNIRYLLSFKLGAWLNLIIKNKKILTQMEADAAAPTREFSNEQKKNLTPQDMTSLIKSFTIYDKNGDNTMDQGEFKQIMIDLGYRKITDEKCAEMLKEQDQNSDGVISWVEFVDMMCAMKGTDDGKFGTVIEGKDGAQA
jgi:hypothetical protein